MYTWLKRRWRLARAQHDEQGSALVLIIGIAAVLTIVVGSGLALAQSATIKSGSDRDAAAAIAAAYAGVADYSARLTNDNSYINKGDPTAPFSMHSHGLSLPAATNPAFCHGQTGSGCTPNTWAPVPGASGNTAFRYEVDNSQYNETGTVQLLSTGRVGKTTRSIRATVRQNGFLQYVYFSNYETIDPTLLAANPSWDLSKVCARYQYSDDPPNPSNPMVGPRDMDLCGPLIQFGGSESIDGPIRSNDSLDICGATFTDKIYTANNQHPNYLYGSTGSCGGASATFQAGPPVTVPNLGLPQDNIEMVADTSSADPNPGCIYTGPTAITFNADGTVTVVSPWTKSTYSDIAQPASNTARAATCGTPGASGLGAPRSASNPSGGQTFNVPAQNLIYVQGVPTSATQPSGNADPNYWGSSKPSLGSAAVNKCDATATGVNNLGYPWTSTNNSTTSYSGGTTYPVSSAPSNGKPTESVTQFNGNPYYNCGTGDVFINGTLSGQVTVAASHYVFITGDIAYKAGTDSILGIDGKQAIWVWNPAYGCTSLPNHQNYNDVVTSTTSLLAGCAPDLVQGGRSINAAMLSVTDTFQVQNYNLVGNGTQQLKVKGSIVQNFRGTVGLTNAKGFSKHYTYDQRLKNISPPRFQNAVAAPWSAIQYSAAQPAYNADGSVH